jgi:hypothetical protein
MPSPHSNPPNHLGLIDVFHNFFTSIDGAPVKLWSKNSIFPSAEFQDFYAIGTLAGVPKSKGRAEAFIKVMKALLTGSRTGGSFDKTPMAKALQLYRNAPT